MAGDGADYKAVDSQRRQITSWLGLEDGRGISPKNAERVAAVLGTRPDLYLSPHHDELVAARRRAAKLEVEAREAREEVRRLTRQKRET